MWTVEPWSLTSYIVYSTSYKVYLNVCGHYYAQHSSNKFLSSGKLFKIY